MGPTKKKVSDDAWALRRKINDLLLELTEPQLEKFHMIHESSPWGSWSACPREHLQTAHDLVARTIAKNHRDGVVKSKPDQNPIPDDYGQW